MKVHMQGGVFFLTIHSQQITPFKTTKGKNVKTKTKPTLFD